MPSEKTPVIEHLFFERFDPNTNSVANPEVTLSDVATAIDAVGANLSTNNPANFFKDIVRSNSRNDWFPKTVVDLGFTAEQLVGAGRCFQFIALPQGQTTAFSDETPDPDLLERVHEIQSVSLSVPSRRLGRPDEAWLTQVAVRLNLLHTHLALHSSQDIVGLELLQTNVKLGNAEIDAVLLAELGGSQGSSHVALVGCEMKSRTEVLEKEQVLRGATVLAASGRAALGLGEVPVIPMAIKALGQGLLWVVEYDSDFPPLRRATEHVYRFRPAVKGIG